MKIFSPLHKKEIKHLVNQKITEWKKKFKRIFYILTCAHTIFLHCSWAPIRVWLCQLSYPAPGRYLHALVRSTKPPESFLFELGSHSLLSISSDVKSSESPYHSHGSSLKSLQCVCASWPLGVTNDDSSSPAPWAPDHSINYIPL